MCTVVCVECDLEWHSTHTTVQQIANYRVHEDTGPSNYYSQITLQNDFPDQEPSTKMHCTHCLKAPDITVVDRCIQSGPKKCIHSLLINIFGINLNEISISG